MFSNKIIEIALKSIKHNNIENVIIYPYGNNGKKVAEMVKASSDLLPFIVDNRIMENEFHKAAEIPAIVAKKKTVVVLTAEDENLNMNMEKELGMVIDADLIVNLLKYRKILTLKAHRTNRIKMKLKNLLPDFA